MKFIEVTDESGDKLLINLNRVEHISSLKSISRPKVHAELYIVNDTKNISIYVQETYEKLKELLNVR